jgi:hypothetical protein
MTKPPVVTPTSFSQMSAISFSPVMFAIVQAAIPFQVEPAGRGCGVTTSGSVTASMIS